MLISCIEIKVTFSLHCIHYHNKNAQEPHIRLDVRCRSQSTSIWYVGNETQKSIFFTECTFEQDMQIGDKTEVGLWIWTRISTWETFEAGRRVLLSDNICTSKTQLSEIMLWRCMHALPPRVHRFLGGGYGKWRKSMPHLVHPLLKSNHSCTSVWVQRQEP